MYGHRRGYTGEYRSEFATAQQVRTDGMSSGHSIELKDTEEAVAFILRCFGHSPAGMSSFLLLAS